jgi:hypothetical protein
MRIEAINTSRLELHAVTPAEYEILDINRADPRLWIDRGFSNPYGRSGNPPRSLIAAVNL